MKETGKVEKKGNSCAKTSRKKTGELFHYTENLELTRKKERNLLIVFWYRGYKSYVSQKD